MSVTSADLVAFTQDFPDTMPLPPSESERIMEILNHLRPERTTQAIAGRPSADPPQAESERRVPRR